ncbi:MAG TPA: amino acid racemase [Steroidobacteraceae bacterium]|nr:amino acid racemase [Steroidobacteraceae bacterium]
MADPGSSQRWIPGLIGVATRTDLVYYQAIHAHGSRPWNGGMTVNSYVTSMFTVDFLSVVQMLKRGERRGIEAQLFRAAASLKASGADFLVLTANTLHAYLDEVRAAGLLPILDIVASSCATAKKLGFRKVGVISTSMTVRENLFQKEGARLGLQILVPSPAQARQIDRVIFEELISGVAAEAGIESIREVVHGMAMRGADCVFLACTDLTHIADSLMPVPVPILDTTRLHARFAALSARRGAVHELGPQEDLGDALLRLPA